MGALNDELEDLQGQVADLERQLSRPEVTEDQEARAVAVAQRMREGLKHMTFEENR